MKKLTEAQIQLLRECVHARIMQIQDREMNCKQVQRNRVDARERGSLPKSMRRHDQELSDEIFMCVRRIEELSRLLDALE